MLRSWILKTTDFFAGPFACSVIARYLRLNGRSKSPSGWAPAKDSRILVIRPGGIGDMILLLPALSALAARFPGRQIDIICERRNMEVLGLIDINIRCIPYDSHPLRFIRLLFRTQYDIAVDSEQFHNFSAVFAALSGAAVRIGFNINPRRNGLYTHLIPYSPDGSEEAQFLRLLKPLGVTSSEPAACSACAATGRILPERLSNMKSGSRLAVIHAGGSIKRKLWPEDSMKSLISELISRHDTSVVILGSESDRARCASIYSDFTGHSMVECISGGLSLAQCAGIIASADIFIGPDSGLLHLAVFLKKPSIALFGPSDHRKWGTEDSLHKIVRIDMPCAPCCIFGYSKPCGKYECIENISVESVLLAFKSLTSAMQKNA